MRNEQEIDAAAAAAAEKANGGKFIDPLFYKPEHRAFWKEVIRTAFDAADAASPPGAGGPPLRFPNPPRHCRSCLCECPIAGFHWLFLVMLQSRGDPGFFRLCNGLLRVSGGLVLGAKLVCSDAPHAL